MNKDVLPQYKEWLIQEATDYLKEYGSYKDLCSYLYSRPFLFVMRMDENRSNDGIALRKRYIEAAERSHTGFYICMQPPCNMLEMMLALAIRCERDILYNAYEGGHVGKLLYSMLTSLGLSEMTDGNFSFGSAMEIVDDFINRRYKPDGSGGLFTISDSSVDMRNEEIWYQMNLYIKETKTR